jgi:hypothetical protein
MLHFLALMLRSLVAAEQMAEKQKVIFLLDSRAHFSVLPFPPGPQSNDKVITQGISGPSRTLFYLASGLLLGKPPLLFLKLQ